MDKAKRCFFSSREGGLGGWVGVSSSSLHINFARAGFFHLESCIHLNCDLSQLLGYVISSVGGNCVKQAHVKDSIQKILKDQSVTFYVRAENKNRKKEQAAVLLQQVHNDH